MTPNDTARYESQLRQIFGRVEWVIENPDGYDKTMLIRVLNDIYREIGGVIPSIVPPPAITETPKFPHGGPICEKCK